MINMKVTTMDQLEKQISPQQIRRIEKAFDEFDAARAPRVTIPQREHLGAVFAPGISCDHKWKQITDEKGIEFIKRKYEETEFTFSCFCTECGATSLWEADAPYKEKRLDGIYTVIPGGRLFAYDATFKFSDKPRVKKPRKEMQK